jgi:hypothetical protein
VGNPLHIVKERPNSHTNVPTISLSGFPLSVAFRKWSSLDCVPSVAFR